MASLVTLYTYKNGTTAWMLDCRIEGHRLRKFYANISKQSAEIEAKKAILKFTENLKKARGENLTLDDLGVKFLEHVKSYKRAWDRDALSIKIFTNIVIRGKRFGEYLLNKIDSKVVNEYRLARKRQFDDRYDQNGVHADDRKYTSINRELACMKYMFTLAVDWDYCDRNPVKSKTIKFFQEQSRTRYLLEDELPLLFTELHGDLRDITLVALNTGMRISEILTLKWVNLDFTKGSITLAKTKNGDPRIIPMNTVVAIVLSLRQRSSEWVFENRSNKGRCKGRPITTIRKGFGNALNRAGIEGFRFHDIRHTFATYLTMEGVDEITRAEILGHRKYTMTSRYSHSTWEKKVEAMQIMARHSQFLVSSTENEETGEGANPDNVIPFTSASGW